MVVAVGLDGGIASGKSTVSKILAGYGAHIINSDKAAHQMYLPSSPMWRGIIEAFGEEVLMADQSIDRRRLGEIVFKDPKALKLLNSIVHPQIIQSIKEEIVHQKQVLEDRSVIILESALIIELKLFDIVDQVWLVIADRDLAVERLCKSRSLTRHQAEERIASQMPNEERTQYAHEIIFNNGAIQEVEDQVAKAWERLFS
tara:strand:- start:145 stop:747 length:603 start_codon:yes stop_codon:yes gene_type:complete